jgi:hypothetical protein
MLISDFFEFGIFGKVAKTHAKKVVNKKSDIKMESLAFITVCCTFLGYFFAFFFNCFELGI